MSTTAPMPSPAMLLPTAQRAPVRGAAAAALARWLVPRLGVRLEVEFPDGALHRATDAAAGPFPRLTVRDPRFFDRVATGGKMGLGESYMAGEWVADDLVGVLEALATAIDRVAPGAWRAVRRLSGSRAPAESDTLDTAARNIRHHYDLSNDFFAQFLDESMTYSSALFEGDEDLEQAQARKRAVLLDDLHLGPDDHLLEIGTGWGSMAIDAARRTGCRVTTITLSPAQADEARRRVARAGLSDRVEVLVADYRRLEGRYDAIVSIEMIEAIGETWWPTYFGRFAELLRPGGRAGLQTITMTHDRWQAARGGYGWIHRYIFPGGEIPSLEALDRPIRAAGLHVSSRRDFGESYVETLRRWRERFLAAQPSVHGLGFDDTFVRMWDFYLAYCEAGFRTQRLGVSQLVLEPR